MKEIKLTKGAVALVDDADYTYLVKFPWYAATRRGKIKYAATDAHPDHYMHRIILKPPAGLTVDHINNNGLDNQRTNLRAATLTQQNRNVLPKKNRKYKGVYTNRTKWRAQIRLNKQSIWLGAFDDEKDAAKAYDEAAKKYFGAFARLNF